MFLADTLTLILEPHGREYGLALIDAIGTVHVVVEITDDLVPSQSSLSSVNVIPSLCCS
jgi:hypothetical protein